MGGSGVVDLFFRKKLPLSFRVFVDEMRALVARNLEGGVNVHPKTSLTQLSEYI
ncbi:unnamed protein product [Brassica rapa]|uniref:Uncharacterized protein n=2 Tax=Brassica TaxID=3705 RepID=A0A3P5ZK78_BRACM|nr:unnamed protein product [Brassica napus]CAG7889342.1 unnamed protein product [Brassica rapa]CDY18080.1 BnaA01g23410D [Brassica napus]VDC76735.1 unnamed protein product [Brassica rapa]